MNGLDGNATAVLVARAGTEAPVACAGTTGGASATSFGVVCVFVFDTIFQSFGE
jgi:hypothetical protein